MPVHGQSPVLARFFMQIHVPVHDISCLQKCVCRYMCWYIYNHLCLQNSLCRYICRYCNSDVATCVGKQTLANCILVTNANVELHGSICAHVSSSCNRHRHLDQVSQASNTYLTCSHELALKWAPLKRYLSLSRCICQTTPKPVFSITFLNIYYLHFFDLLLNHCSPVVLFHAEL